MLGAMAGTCDVGDVLVGDPPLLRRASARRSSTIVLSSEIASSMSTFSRRGSVLARGRLELALVFEPIEDNLCGENDR